MDEFEKPQKPEPQKEEPARESINLTPQPETGGEFESSEKQYEYLQSELTRRYLSLEAQFESDMRDLNKKIAALRKRQEKLQQLSSLLNDPKQDLFYKISKEEIDKRITELEAQLVKIPYKKVGVIGFRKKVENTVKTAPIKQQIEQEKSRIAELDKNVEKQAESNEKRLPGLASELEIETPVAKDKIDMMMLSIKAEIDDLIKKQEQIKQEFISRRDDSPIIGTTPDGQRPIIKQVEVKDKEPGTAFEMMAYGGNAFRRRTRTGSWPTSISEGTFNDYYGMSNKKIGFGVGEKEGRRFIIFRQRQNIQNRGGYPYTVFLDPGEEVRQRAEYNEAVIIRNILIDPVLKHYVMDEPEKVYGMRKILFARLEQSFLRTAISEDTTLQPLIQDNGTEKNPAIFGTSSMVEPTPEKLAQAIATLPEQKRKKITFLIRGAPIYGKYFGVRNIWDSEK